MRKKIYFSKSCVALDIETSDLSPDKGSIIEVAAVKFKKNKIISQFQTLINPSQDIPLIVQSITGITNNDVKNAPALEQVAEKFIKFVGKNPIVGHNIDFDINFLKQKGINLKNNRFDTWKLAAVLVPNLSSHSLESLTSFFDIKHLDSHRALSDVMASIDLFNILMDKIVQIDINTFKYLAKILRAEKWDLAEIFLDIYRQKPKANKKIIKIALEKNAKAKTIKTINELEKVFKNKARLQKAFKSYQYRPAQIELIKILLENLEKKKNALITIDPGVGKEIACLSSSAYFTANFGQNIFMVYEDIQKIQVDILSQINILEGFYSDQINYVVLLAPEQYLCKQRFEYFKNIKKHSQAEMSAIVRLLVWLPQTQTGILQEMAWFYQDEAIRKKINCNIDYCQKGGCPYFNECFYYQSLSKANKNSLILGDYNSFFYHNFNQEENISKNFIINRAFNLEKKYINHKEIRLDYTVIEEQLNQLLESINYLDKITRGLNKSAVIKEKKSLINQNIKKIKNKSTLFFGIVGIFYSKQVRASYSLGININDNVASNKEWRDIIAAGNNLIFLLNGLLLDLRRVLENIKSKKYQGVGGEINISINNLYQIANVLKKLDLAYKDDNFYLIIEENFGKVQILLTPKMMELSKIKNFFIKTSSINFITTAYTSKQIQEYLLNEIKINEKILLQSVAVSKKKKNIKLLVATDIPSPNNSNFIKTAAANIIKITKSIKDGVIISAPSKSMIKEIYEQISLNLRGYNINVCAQGVTGGNEKVFNRYIGRKNSILVATNDFVADRDFPTEKAKCIILLKFPFETPQRGNNVGSTQSYNAFKTQALPRAVFKYLRIVQRISKNKRIRGVFVNFDNRITQANYGDDFIKVLSDFPVEYLKLEEIDKSVKEWLKY